MSLPQPFSSDGPRFIRVTPDDNRAAAIIATILALVFSLLVFLVRMLLVKRRIYGLDDASLSIAHGLAVGQCAVLFKGLRSGLGKSLHTLDDDQRIRISNVCHNYASLFASSFIFI